MAPDAPQAYGFPITLDAAKKIAARALAEARSNNWLMAVAVVDIAGGEIRGITFFLDTQRFFRLFGLPLRLHG